MPRFPRSRTILPTGLLCLLLAAPAPLAGAQAGGPALPEAEASPPAAAPLPPPRPDAALGLQLQRRVERWLAEGAIDAQRERGFEAAGVLGVRVTLRSDGVLLGTGTAWVRPEVLRPRLADVRDGRPDDAPADTYALTQEAGVEAFRAAAGWLTEAAARAREQGRRPTLEGVGAVPRLPEVADRIQADVQVAFGAEAVVAPAAGDPAAGPVDRFVPGYHGLMALSGDAREAPAAEWPATTLAQNLRPRLQLNRVALALGLPLAEADTPGRPGGAPLFRFRVVHAVRPARGAAVAVLERGNVPLPRHRLDAATVEDLADRLAGHLERHYPPAGPVRGTWLPARGRFDPSLADLQDAALGCLALAEHDRLNAELAAAEDRPPPARVSSRVPGYLEEIAAALDMPPEEARRALGVGDDAAGPAPEVALDPAPAALLTLARLATRGGEADPISRRFAAELLARCGGGAVSRRPAADGTPTAGVSLTVRAMAGYALGLHGLAAADEAQVAAGAEVLDAVWAEGDGAVVGAGFSLPWVARAAAEVTPALVERGLVPAGEAARRRGVLEAVLPVLQERQVVQRPVDAPADVLGGFLLRPPPPGGHADPTWTTAPLLQFLSLGLTGFGSGEATPADAARSGLLISAGSAAGFLAQLAMDGPSLYYARSPRNAVGGLRLAFHDARLPIGPTASGLLAIDALRASLAELGR
ncbi:hypothetical protein [Phycisphaera mikurensis]|uniref:AMMECR1 domain-containing protein n=1 Tax=Phycisphaera mikurensis (strain NBRC 102666 / KCTC 22515 / FYK2301M01) TaxID=1142394 RepID=I0IHS3_PHYMF|nr:hypothetical protein [Phycisphaera mikurensis]MBB6441055.1 hypothetical protein [Phycisphaera mikurensis]BAM04811.1 hypothetical protein PSMK_26520 [Phycisphaera mikurensis NBRC 102666]